MGEKYVDGSFDNNAAKSSYAQLIGPGAPGPYELSAVTDVVIELEPYSTEHDDFLEPYLAEIESTGFLYSSYSEINDAYNSLVDSLNLAINEFEGADSNGGVDDVDGVTTGTTGGGTTTVAGSEPTVVTESTNNSIQSEMDTLNGTFQTTDEIKESENELESKIVETVDSIVLTPNKDDTVTDTQVDTDASDTKTISDSTAVVLTSGIGATIGASTTGSLNVESSSSSSAYTNYQTDSSSVWSKLDNDSKANIDSKLQELGFTGNEISTIKNGVIDVPEIGISTVKSKLEEAYKTNPSIKDDLIEQYGFDVFNSDGTIDKDRLSIAMLMDDKNGQDSYSVIELLHTKYNIDVVDQTTYTSLSSRLTDVISTDSSIRDKIVEQYGFDVYNSDGTINRDRLSLAMMIDNNDKSDGYDLLNYLNTNYPNDKVSSLLDNVANPLNSTSNVRTSSVAIGPILAGIGVASVAGGATAVKIRNKKDENSEKNNIKILKKKEDKSQKNWLEKIGINIDNMDIKDPEEKEDYLDENY